MSSCLIITQGNKMYIGADTACSIITEDGYRRFSDDMPKLFSLGNSVFFCSGRKIDAEKCVNWIYDNFKTEIDIKELEHYFKDVSTVVNKDNLFNIEFLLCDYNNHKVVQLSQYNDFKPMIYDYSDELRILCGGYKTKDSFLMAKKNLILNKSTREIYKDVFESISDECVGGKVILYNSPTSFEIISLKESDIKYANNDNELFLLTSDFVTSGVVNGSQIIGGDIYSENYSSTKGTYINLNDGSFSFAGGKLKYDDEIGLLVDGIIHATEGGTIGGFNIGKSAIYSGTNSITSSTKGIYLGTNGIRQYESSTANVTIANGVLTANGANITGTITAENGKIGGWTINKTTLTGGNITLNSNGSLSGGSTYTWSIGTTGAASFSNLTITGGSINVNNKFKVDSQGNVSLPAGTKLSWTDVTNQPTIPTNTNQLTNGAGYQTASQVTQITKDTVTTSFVNALKITAGSVAAENISGTTISGKTISGGTVSGSTITGGSINIGSGTFTVSNAGAVSCSNLSVSGGTITLGDATINSSGITISGTKSSKLGCVKVDENSLYIGSWGGSPRKTPDVFMCSGSSTYQSLGGSGSINGWCFGAGDNFGVTKEGKMYCSAGKIGGVTIYNDGSLRGGRVGIFPSGVTFTGNSNTFYYVIYDIDGSPIGGLTTSGWKEY